MEDVITNYWHCLNPSSVHGLLGLNRLVLLVAMGLRSPLHALLIWMSIRYADCGKD